MNNPKNAKEIRFEKESDALRKNLLKRKKQQEQKLKLKEKKGTKNGQD